MNKKLLLTLALCSFFVINKVQAKPINTAFKDDNFYKCIIDNYNAENGKNETVNYNMTSEDFDTIEHLICDNQEIEDITGIELLESLQTVNLSNNKLTTIAPLVNSKSTTIEIINVSKNNIKWLYMPSLPNVIELDISENGMEHLAIDHYIPTLKLSGNDFLKNLSINLREETTVSMNNYIYFGNMNATTEKLTVEYTIQDTTIAEKDSRGTITGKKEGTTNAQLIIKNGDQVIYAPTTTGEFPSNSKITVVNACPVTTSGAKRYTITLETNGGNKIDNISEAFNFAENLSEKELKLPTPTKDGYKFLGWYKDAELKNEAKIETYKDIIGLENINEEECGTELIVKLYAKWEKTTDNKTTQNNTKDTNKTSNTVKNPATGTKTTLIISSGIIATIVLAGIIIKSKNKYNKI